MRTLALLSLAAPGALAGYAILTGYLLARIQPIPITFVPQRKILAFNSAAQREDDDSTQAIAV